MPSSDQTNSRSSSIGFSGMTPICVALLLSFPFSPSVAEVTCASTISYTWTKQEDSSHQSEIHSVALSRGSSENEAKAELSIKTRRAQVEALTSCRQEHETVSSCASRRFRQAADIVRNGSLSARRALETSISTECAQTIGRCISTDVSQPECRTIETAAAQSDPPAESPAAKEKVPSESKK